MVLERFVCRPGREPAPLVQALECQGAAVTVVPGDPPSGETTVHVHLPDDEYREKRCREILAEWRGAPVHWRSARVFGRLFASSGTGGRGSGDRQEEGEGA